MNDKYDIIISGSEAMPPAKKNNVINKLEKAPIQIGAFFYSHFFGTSQVYIISSFKAGRKE